MMKVTIHGVTKTIAELKNVNSKIENAGINSVREATTFCLNTARRLAPGKGKYGVQSNTNLLINSLTQTLGANKKNPWGRVYARKLTYPKGRQGFLKDTEDVLQQMNYYPTWSRYWRRPSFFKETRDLTQAKFENSVRNKVSNALKK